MSICGKHPLTTISYDDDDDEDFHNDYGNDDDEEVQRGGGCANPSPVVNRLFATNQPHHLIRATALQCNVM